MKVFTAGTFDLFHPGHVNVLREAALLGELTVGLNTDGFVQHYKGKPPVMGYFDRAAVVQACRYVTAVVPVGQHDLGGVLRMVSPKYLVIGSDWAEKDYYRQIGVSQHWLDDQGVTLVYVPCYRGVSTTELRRRCR